MSPGILFVFIFENFSITYVDVLMHAIEKRRRQRHKGFDKTMILFFQRISNFTNTLFIIFLVEVD